MNKSFPERIRVGRNEFRFLLHRNSSYQFCTATADTCYLGTNQTTINNIHCVFFWSSQQYTAVALIRIFFNWKLILGVLETKSSTKNSLILKYI